MRVNINLDEELLKQVDEEAKKMFVSRSSYIAFAVAQKINNDKMMSNLPEIVKTMKDAVELEKAKTGKTVV